MRKLLNKIMARFGYYPRDSYSELLKAVVKESVYRNGEMLEVDEMGLRIKIAAKDYTSL